MEKSIETETFEKYVNTYYDNMMIKYKILGGDITLALEKDFKIIKYSSLSDEYLKEKLNYYTNSKMNEIKRFRIYVFNDILIKRRMSKLNKIKQKMLIL